ncbi:MAG: DUF3667 domain-containing protein [Candidatus Cyclobacteriaceae bacterium M3_2C_046]
MKIRRKLNRCLNCNYTLDEIYNYCPNCGQENNDVNITLKGLLGDFFHNYFSFDSKLFRSFKPFLVKPGWLTHQFNEGKRASYVNPIRLYLIISFFYFFMLSLIISPDEFETTIKDSESIDTNAIDKSEISGEISLGLQPLKERLGNNEANGSLQTDSLAKGDIEADSTDPPFSFEDVIQFIDKNADNPELSNQDLLDSLNISARGNEYMVENTITQARKLIAKPELFYNSLMTNLPIMMFLLLPVFAIILKLLFLSRKQFYISHVVHALHLHSFAFFIFGISFLIYSLIFSNGWVYWISFYTVIIYGLFSLKNVYGQSYPKTMFKYVLLGFSYFFLLLIFVVLELVLSFYLF